MIGVIGSEVEFVGRVGEDDFGKALTSCLHDNGVITKRLKITKNCSSGVALIQVDSQGKNNITVIPASNHAITMNDLEENEEFSKFTYKTR